MIGKRIAILIFLFSSLMFLAQSQNEQFSVVTLDVKEGQPQGREDYLPPEFHAGRRILIRESLPIHGVAVFFSNTLQKRANDVNFEFHQDPDFYYLTGFNEPNAVLFIAKDSFLVGTQYVKELMIVPPKNLKTELWDGWRLGKEGVAKLGFDAVLYSSEFSILSFCSADKFIYHNHQDINGSLLPGTSEILELKKGVDEKLKDANALQIKFDLNTVLAGSRELKTHEELYLLQKAIDITCLAHNELAKGIFPQMKEYEAEAIVEYVFKREGAEYPGFPSILGSGANGCILHYIENRSIMGGNSLLVADIGAEYHGYTADVTRTFPVDGVFSEEQKIIYELVLKAQLAGIEACKVGASFWAGHVAATTVLSQGLQDLGIISSPLELRKYFMHGTSHYLGLDVHDRGTYGPLQVNSVITIEPGIYIRAGSPCEERWWNIGVRIEDDVLITELGPVVMSAGAPKSVREIEMLMKEKSAFSK